MKEGKAHLEKSLAVILNGASLKFYFNHQIISNFKNLLLDRVYLDFFPYIFRTQTPNQYNFQRHFVCVKVCLAHRGKKKKKTKCISRSPSVFICQISNLKKSISLFQKTHIVLAGSLRLFHVRHSPSGPYSSFPRLRLDQEMSEI